MELPYHFLYFFHFPLAPALYLRYPRVDVSIFEKAKAAGVGTYSYLQEKMIFEKDLTGKVQH